MMDLETWDSLPPGDPDPNTVYIAVGKSIHRWESLEQELATLCLKLSGIPDLPESYLAFGQKNGTFAHRMAALVAASETYFINNSDQHKEGTFLRIVERAQELSIERHRIAHGHITMWGQFKTAEGDRPGTMTATMLFRWAPPFYGVLKLRTNPVGGNGEALEATSLQFEELTQQVAAFIAAL